MGSMFSELWDFMRVRKKWWLAPIVVTLMLLSALIVFTRDPRSPRSSTRCSEPAGKARKRRATNSRPSPSRRSRGTSPGVPPGGTVRARRCGRPRRRRRARRLALVLVEGSQHGAGATLAEFGRRAEVVALEGAATAGDADHLLRQVRARVGQVLERRDRAVREGQERRDRVVDGGVPACGPRDHLAGLAPVR